MDGFNTRKKAFETKFSHDKDIEFRIQAKRNRMFGLWAAEQMVFTPDEGENYAQEVIMASFEIPGDIGVLEKVSSDLERHSIEISNHRLKKELERYYNEAHAIITTDGTVK